MGRQAIFGQPQGIMFWARASFSASYLVHGINCLDDASLLVASRRATSQAGYHAIPLRLFTLSDLKTIIIPNGIGQ